MHRPYILLPIFHILFPIFYNKIPMQSIRILCNIYNFIPTPTPQPPNLTLQSIEQFRQIFLLINQFISNQYINPKCIFEQLYQFINKEEESFGPKKFKKMIESISNIIFEFILGKLRSDNTDAVILCLTYYERYCSKYFSPHIRSVICLVYSLAHFKKDNINLSENYINEAKQYTRTIQKSPEENCFASNIKIIVSIMEGVARMKEDKLTKSKFIFNETISHLTEKMHDEQTKTKRLTIETASYFTITTFYISQVYLGLSQAGKSAYHITQCKEFAMTHLPQAERLIAHLQESHSFTMSSTVKLGRIQNKIERIKSLHNFNSNQIQLNAHKQNRVHFKITKKQKDLKLNDQRIKNQLQNLLVLEETNEARLKKKTLKELQAEQLEKQRKIGMFQQQISSFYKEKEEITNRYQNEQEISLISLKMQEKQVIKSQISAKIWPIVHTLKATKKIQTYLTGFKSLISYETTNKFFKFLYHQVSLKGHLKIYSCLRKIRSKLIREVIRSIVINGTKHQIELSKHKINPTYHMKVYQIEKGPGVNIEREVSPQVYDNLKTQKFCYNFHIDKGVVLTLKEYLDNLPNEILTQVKGFALKLKKRLLKKNQELLFQKKYVYITFNTFYTELKYTVFITSRKLTSTSYSHSIERIDNHKVNNNDYNIKFNETITTNALEVRGDELTALLTQHILKEKQKHVALITKLQKLFRFKLSQLLLIKKKESIQVHTVIINRNLYSLIVNGNVKTFYIQNLDKRFPIIILNTVSFFNLSFIHKLRNELIANDDCIEQLNIIKKYFRLRNFAFKFIKKSQEVKLDTKFSTKFKKSLCFAKITKQYLYRGKLIEGKMMYMLTVNNFQAFPRPYMLRVFTIQHKNLYLVDYEQVIFNSEKIYLENYIDKINQIIDIQEHRKANILFEGPAKLNYKLKRANSKSTLVSNFSFGSGEEFLKERGSRMSRVLHSRESNLMNRNKKNSINFKMRHKSALKQKDIMLIKKWIQDSKEDSSISQSEQSSNQ